MSNELPESILNTLKFIYEEFEKEKVKWILTGSVGLKIRGVDVVPHDIDIVTDKENAFRINKILKKFKKQKVEFSETDKYKSFRGVFVINGIEVDVMGDFQYKLENGNWSTIIGMNQNFPCLYEKNQLNKVVIVDFKGMKIPMLTLEQELKEYESMGREDKVKKIRERLGK